MGAPRLLFLACYVVFCAASEPCNPNDLVADACTSYASLDRLNNEISPFLQDATQTTDFFAYYRLNLYNKVCPFWSDESSVCGNRACAVDTIEDERDVPDIWKAEELSKLEGMRAKHPGRDQQKQRPKKRPLQYQLGENVDETCVLEDDDECDERDYCLPEDEGATAKGDYVSLVNNSERFTGYSGPGARQVWDAIYKENCFPRPPKLSGGLQAASDLHSIFQDYSKHHLSSSDDLLPLEDECLEQRAFYRIISGMHTSISTHLCWDYFNQRTGEWFHNLTCYKDRLHEHPERISNLYFNYALVTRAVAKLGKHLEHYTFCSGDPDQDYDTKQKVLALASRAASEPSTFDETIMFTTPELLDLKVSFRHRFRNVSRLMDCVGCDKCRLWGKVQTAGYGAALKVLFEFDEAKNGENPSLRRTELVALINTWGRISHSLNVIDKFRKMVSEDENEIDTNNINRWVPAPTFGYASQSEGFSEAVPTDETPRKDWGRDDNQPNEPPEIKLEIENHPLDDDEDTTDLEADHYAAQPRVYPQRSISQEIYDEVDLVWRAYKMVIRSWMELPFTLPAIAIMELNRLWSFWLGMPVPERSWELQWPEVPHRRDEL